MATIRVTVAQSDTYSVRKVATALGAIVRDWEPANDGSVGYTVAVLETEDAPLVGHAAAEAFANGLAEKFDDPSFRVDKGGRKYHRIIHTLGSQTMVHAFVEAETGYVFKSAGWTGPAKGTPAYDSVNDALQFADKYGYYLYAATAKQNRAS